MRHFNFSKQLHKNPGLASSSFPPSHLFCKEYWRSLNGNTWGVSPVSPGQCWPFNVQVRWSPLNRKKCQTYNHRKCSLQCCCIQGVRNGYNCMLQQWFSVKWNSLVFSSATPDTAACKNVTITGYYRECRLCGSVQTVSVTLRASELSSLSTVHVQETLSASLGTGAWETTPDTDSKQRT